MPNFTGSCTLIKGKPESASLENFSSSEKLALLYGKPDVKIFEHLDSNALALEIEKASLIICRSGYTSLMELLPQHKKLVLVPTPGQPEQKYLAQYCQQNGWAPYLTQECFSIEKANQLADAFSYQQYTPSALLLQPILKEWVNSLSGKNS
mgnify:FL=1